MNVYRCESTMFRLGSIHKGLYRGEADLCLACPNCTGSHYLMDNRSALGDCTCVTAQKLCVPTELRS